jgi:hypothetical protein
MATMLKSGGLPRDITYINRPRYLSWIVNSYVSAGGDRVPAGVRVDERVCLGVSRADLNALAAGYLHPGPARRGAVFLTHDR